MHTNNCVQANFAANCSVYGGVLLSSLGLDGASEDAWPGRCHASLRCVMEQGGALCDVWFLCSIAQLRMLCYTAADSLSVHLRLSRSR